MEKYDWFKSLNCAVTVCDIDGIVIYMNDKSINTNGNAIGKNLFGCHKEASWNKIIDMMKNGSSNAYTIDKKGVKKLIYQTPWYDGDKIGGLVELSIVIPEEMPHYQR